MSRYGGPPSVSRHGGNAFSSGRSLRWKPLFHPLRVGMVEMYPSLGEVLRYKSLPTLCKQAWWKSCGWLRSMCLWCNYGGSCYIECVILLDINNLSILSYLILYFHGFLDQFPNLPLLYSLITREQNQDFNLFITAN